MARPRKDGDVMVEILRDGVWGNEGERSDKGDKPVVSPEIAAILIERGHAKRL
jgi:hypothetical protein